MGNTRPTEEDYLSIALFDTLTAIGYGHFHNHHHFSTHTLFWSLTRLFGCYERVLAAVDLPRDERPFLDADIEAFIIRYRIVLNEVAFLIRCLLPEQVRGLKGPKGNTHRLNREVSMYDLGKFLASKADEYPEFHEVFRQALPWIKELRKQRDRVVHYKAMVLVFEDSSSFAIVDPGTHARPEGKLELESVRDFVHGQMRELYHFMDSKLDGAVNAFADRLGLRKQHIGIGPSKIYCPGILRFNKDIRKATAERGLKP